MKRTRQFLGFVLITALVSPSLAAEPKATNAPAAPAARSGSDLFADNVIVKGKGVEIKRSRLDEEIVSIKAAAAARKQTIPPEHMSLLERQILDRLISIQLLLNKATPADKAKGKETADKRIEEIKKRAGDEETLNRQLKMVGSSMQELERKMTEELTAEAVLE
ncbi:MAG TPA: hypothetical protein VN673_17145, partial [Clostridia bacterium]|nr:hypothetical protein [Clostridia bacterium]